MKGQCNFIMWVKQNKDNIMEFIKVGLFCVGLICIISTLSNILVSKSSEWKLGTYFEKEGDFDVLFTGKSQMEVGISPMELWGDYGITSFNFGAGGTVLPSSYWIIRNAVNYKVPKLVVIDVRGMDQEIQTSMHEYGLVNWDYVPLNKTKFEAALDLFSDREDQLEFLIPFIRYHSRWTELKKDDFKKPTYRIDKGRYVYDTVDSAVAQLPTYELLPETSKLEMGAAAKEYLCKLIEFCQEKGIEVLLTVLPMPANETDQKYANGVSDIAEKYNVDYINFYHVDGIVDFDTDMYVEGHLNESGMRKVTRYLGQYIQNNYSIPDKREDINYKQWDEEYQAYRAYCLNRVHSQMRLDNRLMLLADRKISSCIFIKGGSKILQDNRMVSLIKNVSQYIMPMRIEEAAVSGKDYLLIIDNLRKVIWENVGDELLEVDTAFGHIAYERKDLEGGYLYINNDGKNYLNMGDVVTIDIDNMSQKLNSVIYSVDPLEVPVLSATELQMN